ncbi:response regulator transcription factor [Noviherbaspirillum denitrificans]|uniref:Two-component system response regulator n=1 Tax=Noviherbaspirillum denitrificans TaxID=1968433 RepID=A0A254TCA9_9BURK|nr:response regulator [Noviherbaspirillum denitrificans]OWW18193.1 two-component system response regulator [Noviherbaspirillum denitrificans]
MVKTILIADDEPNIVASLEFLMKREGFEVMLAGNGIEAIQAMESKIPDLILLDVMMPGKDGYDVCRQIRATAAWHQMKIVMLSAKSRDSEIAKGLALGADAYITKPFSSKELVQRVRQLLGADA